MCALDRRERPLNSQSVNKYILNVQISTEILPFRFVSVTKTGKSFMPMGPLLNSFPEKINPLSGESYIRLQVEIFSFIT